VAVAIGALGIWLLIASRRDSAGERDRPATLTASGALAMGPRGLAFTPCSGVSATDLVDRTDGEAAAIIKELAGDAGSVVAVVRLRGDTLVAIRYAGLEGPPCEALPPEGDYMASGTEPFWHLALLGDSARVTSPEVLDGAWYHRVTRDTAGGTLRIMALGAEGDTLRATFVAGRCADGMSGARDAWRAVITWRDRTMEGCALEGRGR
jgi:uncharacterized membrane protein